MEDYDKYVVACYDGHTPGKLQRRRLATGAENGSFMSISQEVFQQAPAYYAENPVTQRMLLCAVDRACAYASQAAAACAEYSRVVAENERLQHQLAQRQTAEDAYRELWLNSDRCYTFDRTGRAVELLNCTTISSKSAALPPAWYSRGRISFVTLYCCRGLGSFQESGSALPGLSEEPHTWSAGLLMRFSKSIALASLAAGRKWRGTLSASACSPTTPLTPTVDHSMPQPKR